MSKAKILAYVAAAAMAITGIVKVLSGEQSGLQDIMSAIAAIVSAAGVVAAANSSAKS